MSDPYLDEMMRRAKAKQDAIALTQSEAEKLARNVLKFLPQLHSSSNPWYGQVQSLANGILSGSMKREIENEALKLAIVTCEKFAKEQRVYVGQYAYTANAARECSSRIRALIQPPAQTRDSQEMGVYFQPPQEAIKSTTIFKLPAQQENEEC